jgi:hypothetical protein
MIGSLMSRMGMAQKLSVAQLKQAVQDGTIPAYIGVPMIQDKLKQQQEAQAGKQAPAQPPVAEQVLAAAGQEERGIDSGRSNLEFSQGGIAYALGGDVDSEDYDDYMQEAQDEQDAEYAEMMSENQGIGGLGKEAAFVNKTPNVEKQSFGIKGPSIDSLLSHILKKESGGRDYDAKGNPLTSSRGAKYSMQVMPSTARDPGFGIKPAKDESAEEYNRVGRELAEALLGKYKDPRIAAAAYNWGSGNVDKWLAKGGDESMLPKETQGYLVGANFAEGGIASVARYDGATMGSLVQSVPQAAQGNAMLQDYLSNLDTSSPEAPDYEAMIAQENARLRGRAPQTGIPSLVQPVPQAAQGNAMLSNYVANAPAYQPEPAPAVVPRQLPRSQARAFEGIKDLMTPAPSQRTIAANRALLASKTPEPSPVRIVDGKAVPNLPSGELGIPADVQEALDKEAKKKKVPSEEDAKKFLEKRGLDANTINQGAIDKLEAGYPKVSEEEGKAAEMSPWDQYLSGLGQAREDIKKQKDEDKYLSLLAAGLSMMQKAGTVEPGKVHTAAGDISGGGLEGVGMYANLSKQRAAQEAALNKELGTGLYRQQIAKATAGSKEKQLSLQQATLQEQIRGHDLADKQRQEAAFQKWQTIITAPFDKRMQSAVTDEDKAKIQQERDEALYNNPIYRSTWKKLYPDLPMPAVTGGAGWSITPKTQ